MVKRKIGATRTKRLFKTEELEQFVLIDWLRLKKIIHFAIPNGGHRDIHTAVKLKRGGLMAGVPDLCIPLARKPYHGLYIELKRVKGGVVSDVQKWWLAALAYQGYKATVCKGARSAINEVENYLSLPYWGSENEDIK